MARPHKLRAANPTVNPETALQLHQADALMSLDPIPQPKPWSDELERAAIWHALHSAPPEFALSAAGVVPSTAKTWLSDEPPPCYQSACTSLSLRLKQAEQACAAGLFANIHKAAQDPRYWTAAAWTLERKHGYVAQQQGQGGPTTVVNIGQVTINAQAAPNREPIIDAQAIQAETLPSLAESLAVEGKR
jgi:hypothetical protein